MVFNTTFNYVSVISWKFKSGLYNDKFQTLFNTEGFHGDDNIILNIKKKFECSHNF